MLDKFQRSMPRNHGFLVEAADSLALSPAYDLVPTLARVGVGTDFKLAMTCGKSGREATLANASSGAARFGLSSKKAKALIKEMCTIVREWRHYFKECGVSAQDIDKLTPSFAQSELG